MRVPEDWDGRDEADVQYSRAPKWEHLCSFRKRGGDYKNRKCRQDHTTRKPPKRWYCGRDLIEISDDELEEVLQLDDDVPADPEKGDQI